MLAMKARIKFHQILKFVQTLNGNVKFNSEADAPDLSKLPYEQLFGLMPIIIIGKYMGQQFKRFGYIVDVYQPGF